MNKKATVLSLLLASSVLTIASCSSSASGPKEYPYEEDTSVKTDSVYLGFFETKAYSPSDDVAFQVTIADTSIVKYEDGAFVSAMKAGTTTASFRSSSLSYDVAVTVRNDGTVPSFNLETEELSVYKGATYKLDTSLFYRGLDMSEYETGLRAYCESDKACSQIAVDGSSLLVTASEIGTDVYTIYTEFAGINLSKTLTVSVKNNNGLVICGKNLVYDNNGPHYTISMYKYDESPISLKEDIVVLKGGLEVAYDALSVTFDDPATLSLNGELLAPKKTGKTFFTVSTGGESIKVGVEIYKPVLNAFDFEVANNRFDLDMSLEVTDQKERVYTANASKSLTFLIPARDARYENVSKVLVNGKEISAKFASFDGASNAITLQSGAFGIENYGKQEAVFYVDAADYTDTFTCTIDFVTKYLTAYKDLSTYFTQLSGKDTIVGQYILQNDLDGEGKDATGVYASLGVINYSCGFRGILDGNGFAIKNFKSTNYGIFLLVGNGATFKNLTFENVYYSDALDNIGRGNAFFGRFVTGATFDNVTVRLSSDSVTNNPSAVGGKTNSVGLFVTEVFNWCILRNVDIHAEGLDLPSLFGKNLASCSFYNVNLYANSLKFVGGSQTAVDGLNLIQA